MSVSNREVSEAVELFVDMYPGEARALQPIRGLLESGIDVTDPEEPRGHVTSSAVVVSPSGMVLIAHYVDTDLWTFPGGHLNRKADRSLIDAALRNVYATVGIQPHRMTVVSGEPSQMHMHAYTTQGRRHRHLDIRFLVHTKASVGLINPDVVDRTAWVTPQTLDGNALRALRIRSR